MDPGYLASALDEVTQAFGTIDGYFSTGLGVDADGQQALRRELREPQVTTSVGIVRS